MVPGDRLREEKSLRRKEMVAMDIRLTIECSMCAKWLWTDL